MRNADIASVADAVYSSSRQVPAADRTMFHSLDVQLWFEQMVVQDLADH